uniref:Uncharacterized protein n=1 Tax=Chromera velia CCMP2878 TaxID=1169474 RepID=A0A0G4F219_9ALVE|eukprot:Cvel_14786.t1-p1 / transcript=Cvel_14786.t1 / gene=Cvel_14786 / organism=Chromera_velia_CCMP2878 / gene_product=hypothetical protein / transcript_product=hypothetical protein / location=Cvel_scaffold1065:7831-18172(+) / protein_length=341 / sequence_SO=supercontig / SO=protein_coding / is_pseudo=false
MKLFMQRAEDSGTARAFTKLTEGILNKALATVKKPSYKADSVSVDERRGFSDKKKILDKYELHGIPKEDKEKLKKAVAAYNTSQSAKLASRIVSSPPLNGQRIAASREKEILDFDIKAPLNKEGGRLELLDYLDSLKAKREEPLSSYRGWSSVSHGLYSILNFLETLTLVDYSILMSTFRLRRQETRDYEDETAEDAPADLFRKYLPHCLFSPEKMVRMEILQGGLRKFTYERNVFCLPLIDWQKDWQASLWDRSSDKINGNKYRYWNSPVHGRFGTRVGAAQLASGGGALAAGVDTNPGTFMQDWMAASIFSSDARVTCHKYMRDIDSFKHDKVGGGLAR